MPKEVLFMTTNYLPTVTGSDNGIWRRIVPIPMTTVIKNNETDTSIGDKLFAEQNGILYQLIQTAKDHQQNGLRIPIICENARQQYCPEMDTVKQFLDDVAIITNNPNDKVSNRDLYNAFDRWNSDVETHLTHQGLSKELQRRGFGKCKSNGKHGRRGLKLKPEYQPKNYLKSFKNVPEIGNKPLTMEMFGIKYSGG